MPPPTPEILAQRTAKWGSVVKLRDASPLRDGELTGGGPGHRTASRSGGGGNAKGSAQHRTASRGKEKWSKQQWQDWEAQQAPERSSGYGRDKSAGRSSGYGREASPDRPRGQKRAADETGEAGDAAPAVEVVMVHKAPNPQHPVINSVV